MKYIGEFGIAVRIPLSPVCKSWFRPPVKPDQIKIKLVFFDSSMRSKGIDCIPQCQRFALSKYVVLPN